MAKTFCCPFFSWEGRMEVHCGGGVLYFRDAELRAAYLNRHCAEVPGWEECPLARALCVRE